MTRTRPDAAVSRVIAVSAMRRFGRGLLTDALRQFAATRRDSRDSVIN
ncbi:hypothetical protein [Streptomyces sp. NPDC057302]